MRIRALHKQQMKIGFDKNLLNNQNYILGKTEKKKLLSKFFVEKNILFFQNFLYQIEQILSKYLLEISGFSFLIGPVIVGAIFYNFFYTKYLFDDFYLFIGAFLFSLISFVITILIFYIFSDKLKIKKLSSIRSAGEYFLRKGTGLIGGLFIGTIILVFITGFFGLFAGLFIPGLLLMGGSILVFGLFYLFKFIFRIRLFNVFFLPILFFIEIFIFTYNLFKFFIFKGVKGFNITKLEPKTSLINRFARIYKNYAENEYYKIEQK